MALLKNLRHLLTHPFNRERPMAALWRVLRWQVSSRLALGPVLVEFVDRMRIAAKPGMTGVTGNIYSGLSDFEDMGFVLHLLRAEDLFVDVGANVGCYSILAAVTGARVISFEPVPDTCKWLELNVRINGLDSAITLVSSAVGRAPGEIAFTYDLGVTNHVVAEERSEGAIKVPVTTLDLALCGATPVMIKMDVEGYEADVVEGAISTLSDPGLCAVLLELNGSGQRYGTNEDDLHETMLRLGYETFTYDPWSRSLTPRSGARGEEGNTLYLKNLETIVTRLAQAPRFQVQGRSI